MKGKVKWRCKDCGIEKMKYAGEARSHERCVKCYRKSAAFKRYNSINIIRKPEGDDNV